MRAAERTQRTRGRPTDAARGDLRRLGGHAFMAAGLILLATPILMPLAFVGGDTPSPPTAEAFLAGFGQAASTFRVIRVMLVLATVLLAPALVALDVQLRDVRRGVRRVGLGWAWVGLAVLMVAHALEFSLITAAVELDHASDADREVPLAIASFAFTLTETTFLLAVPVLSLGILVLAYASAGTLSRRVAYLGMAAGAVGVIRVVPSLVFISVTGVLWTLLLGLWAVLTGRELSRSRRMEVAGDRTVRAGQPA